MTKKKIRQLEQKRTNILASLDRCEDYSERCNSEEDRHEINLRLNSMDKLWSTFEEVQTDIECHEESLVSESQHMSTREKFETKFFRVKGALLSKIPDAPSQQLPADRVQQSNSSYAPEVKLPTITLPEFDGDYNQWLTFHDTFMALIHSSNEISTVQKFHYLRAALRGEAAQLIESLTISCMNYPVAWKILVDRYSNSYLLKKRHMHTMLDHPKIKRESASALHGLIDTFERHSKILKQLQEPVDSWSTIMVHLLCSRLDDATLKLWEDHASTLLDPNYGALIEFLQRRTRVLESLQVNIAHSSQTPIPAQPFKRLGPAKVYAHAAAEERVFKCVACSHNHRLVECQDFPKMSHEKQLDLVNSNRLCSNCFRSDHFVKNCPSKFRCRTCKGKHHTIIHPGFPSSKDTTKAVTLAASASREAELDRKAAGQNASTSTLVNTAAIGLNTFLMMAVVKVVDRHGNELLARAMLDCGSMSNIMTERLSQMLRLKGRKMDINVHGVGTGVIKCNQMVTTEVRSRLSDYAVTMEFLVLNKVTSKQPLNNIDSNAWNIPDNVSLADPKFNVCGEVDIILGIQHFFSFFRPNRQINLGHNLPLVVETVFGWVIAGASSFQPHSRITVTNCASIESVNRLVERFWEVEEMADRKPLSIEEEDCETLYYNTTTRNEQGRYIVRLPTKPEIGQMLGESKSAALHRFNLLERQFEKNEDLKTAYHSFMREYLQLHHMEPVPDGEHQTRRSFYLPHHPVLKASSSTTKLRVVFDGSAKTSSGNSLNDSLLVGPVLQDELLQIVIRFRKYAVALKILWRFDPSEPIQTYQLCTVTYGLGPSSYLATKTLIKLAEDEGQHYPKAAPLVSKGYYIDDFIGGDDTVEGAIELRKEMNELMAGGGFPLRKWTSNRLEVLQGLPSDQIGTQSSVKFNPDETIKTLGIIWEPESDCLRFNLSIKERDGILTKRKIQSCIAQLYDPLGLISPVVITAKIIMQRLWLIPIGWDDEVPKDLQELWEDFRPQIEQLSYFKVDRFVFLPDAISTQLHCFANASKVAYGCCLYARTVDRNGTVKVQLISSKSRVAPLKRLSIPRLELCAAQLSARLYNKVIQALGMEFNSVHLWSDSTVVLNWLRAPPYHWKTFVANRVSEIQTTTRNATWRHVPGLQNPADLVSRGMHVNAFLESKLWSIGSEWLSKSEENWPRESPLEPVPEELMERETVAAGATCSGKYNEIFTRYSHFNKMLRVVAWISRFRRNCQSRRLGQPSCLNATLTVEELEQSKGLLLRLVQSESYLQEIKDLHTGKLVSPRSTVRALNPFQDEQGLLRVGGRLQHSNEPYESKHPILIPGNHPFTKLLARHYHHKLLHGGPRLMLAVIREQYWPVNGKRLLHGIIRTAFMSALRRFIARRGKPSHIHSDNGRNFIGARNELHEIYRRVQNQSELNHITNTCATEGIRWHLIPPKAPNFGGLWESAVKIAKRHLQRQLRNSLLNFEEMVTVLAQIEACMNSRPLAPLAEDTSDLSALTPAHFLIGCSLHSIPDPNLRDIPLNRLDRFQRLQEKAQQFWHRWRSDYLKELQRDSKPFRRLSTPLKPGTMVILRDDSLHPTRWPLARIIEANPGEDGVVRVVVLRTCSGVVKRPASQLCLLPADDQQLCQQPMTATIDRALENADNEVDKPTGYAE
ncbi:uncharacterized protein LOC131687940 [Topomyia yanbarensis]|uniref:uncharacterized protein LOC131687940 n=1 Tax=Topomyia yanbarensis TaxID=2498891 RepID=UPI00273B4825|nr:uncharacterized protein LOC131687940 [Topomyia yanbarensis]